MSISYPRIARPSREPASILVVEDEADYRRLLVHTLNFAGFRVLESGDGAQALEQAASARPNLILLDLNLPDMSGFELCDRLKRDAATQTIPILVMTAFDDNKKDVACLEHGADAYLVKPLDQDRLIAYIRSLLRRAKKSGPHDHDAPLVIGDGEEALRLDYTNKAIACGDFTANDLTPKEFDVLWHLVVNSPNAIPRDSLYKIIWGGTRTDKNYKTVDVHVHRIREKLPPKLAKRILYVTGRGYSFQE